MINELVETHPNYHMHISLADILLT